MHTLALVAVLISITSSRAADNAVTNLLAGWTATDLGTVRKPGAVSYDAATKAFSIRSIGEATEQRGTFAYTKVKGDFVATCRVTAASQKSVGAGLVMRTDTKPERAFSGIAKSGWKWSCLGHSKRDCRRKPTAFRKDLPFFPLRSSANPDLLKPAFLKRLLRNAPGIAYRPNTY